LRRRDFITLLGGAAAAWPLAARGQQGATRLPRIGILMGQQVEERRDLLLAALQALGWIQGRTVQIEFATSDGDAERTRAHARALLELAPDVILVSGAVGARAFQDLTRTVPIVFVNLADPAAGGFVASLAHPGGNLTGFSNFEFAIGGKWVGLVKELAPDTRRVALLIDPENVNQARYAQSIAAAAPSFAVEVMTVGVHNGSEIEAGISALASRSMGALIAPPNAVIANHAEATIELAARHRLPALFPDRSYVAQGGLLSYGPDLLDMDRRAVSYVDRILKGEKTADLPVQNPTKYELAINLKTAKALGLTVPLTLQYAADEVIE
jgi:putative tryptophan/tyrosine transport system substrate-binding protein